MGVDTDVTGLFQVTISLIIIELMTEASLDFDEAKDTVC